MHLTAIDMCKYLLILGACAILSIRPCDLNAQWICHSTAGMNYGQGTDLYGTYWYTALASRGDLIVGAANVTTLAHHEPYGYYLAFLVSLDGGDVWNVNVSGLPGPTWAHKPIIRKIQIIDSLHMIAFGDSALLVRTTNGGLDWQLLSAPSTHTIGDVSFSDSTHGIMAVWDTAQGTYATTNGGLSWSPMPFTRQAVAQCKDYGNGVYRFFSVYDGRVYTVRNGSVVDSTQPIISDATASHFVFARCSFGQADTLFAYGYRNYYDVRQGLRPFIARSADGGKHWVHVYDADTTNYWDLGSAEYMSEVTRDTIVAGLRGGANQVLWSTNRGATWQFDTLIMHDSTKPLISDSYGLALNARGDLVAANSFDGADGASLLLGTREVESVNQRISQPSRMEAFPLPAANSVTVIAKLGDDLRVIDMLGREVLKARCSSQGEVTLDLTSLSAGVYFISNGDSSIRFMKR